MRKRFLSILLAICMVLTLLPVPVLAADSDFTIENGVLTEYKGSGGDVVIPDGVTVIGENVFCRNANIKSVTIPEGVTEIGASAFEKCTAIKTVTIPASVKTIGERAFMNCVTLKSVSLPEGLETIGRAAFTNCHDMPSITIPSTVTTIGDNAFETCWALTSVTIPTSVKSLGDHAFANCKALSSVTIQPGLTSIGTFAFSNCPALRSVTIPASVTILEGGAFQDCTSLSSVTVLGNPTLGNPAESTLGNDIFKGTPWMANQGDFVVLNGRLLAYQGRGGNVTIPSGVTSIENIAFANNTMVTGVVIPSGVASIGTLAFHNCTSLTSVTIPISLTSIGYHAFLNCGNPLDVYYEGTEEQWHKITGHINLQTESEPGEHHHFSAAAPGTTTPGSSGASGSSGTSETPKTPEISKNPTGFTDVSASQYYYDAVAWAVEKGITAGTSTTTFDPDAPCTRAQIVTFLWRAAGSPKVTASNPFTDVSESSYYYDAVLWAVEQGITAGTSVTTFSPDATCTRAQTVTFLYRYEKSPATSGSNAFTDVVADAYYANAVQWAVTRGVTSGTSATTFSPNATCTRGQIVTFLYRDMK